MTRRRIEVLVGFLVMSGVTAMLLSVIFIGQQQGAFERRLPLSTEFRSVEGLQPGAPVNLAGIQVGSVQAVHFTPDGRVRVEMQVREGVFERIRTDSVARIKSAGLVGDKYIDITVGTTGAESVSPGAIISGLEPLDWNRALEEARPVLDSLATSIENMRLVTNRLADEDSDVSVVLSNLRQITDMTRQGRGTIGRLLSDDEVYQDLRDAIASGKVAAANAKDVSVVLRDQLPGLVDESGQAMRKFGDAVTSVQSSLQDLPQIMANLENAANDLEAAMANFRAVSADLREASPRVPALLSSGQAAVDEARSVLDAARASPLLRRYFEEPAPEEPILVQDRADVPDAS